MRIFLSAFFLLLCFPVKVFPQFSIKMENLSEKIAGGWHVVEKEKNTHKITYLSNISVDAAFGRFYFSNINNLGESVRVYFLLKGSKIEIPGQTIDGNFVQGYGNISNYAREINLQYTVDYGCGPEQFEAVLIFKSAPEPSLLSRKKFGSQLLNEFSKLTSLQHN
jgi:hypothetical protein